MPELLIEIVTIDGQRDTGWCWGRCRAVADPEVSRELDFPGELPFAGVWRGAVEGVPFKVDAKIVPDKYRGWGQKVEIAKGARPERVERLISHDGILRYLRTMKQRADAAAKRDGRPPLGIGEGRLRALVRQLGGDALCVARTEPARVVAECKGWTDAQATAFAAVLAEHIEDEQARLELATLGANGALHQHHQDELFDQFGRGAPAIVRANPYALAHDDEDGWSLRGYGWRMADTLAVANLGWATTHPRRVLASLIEALRAAARDGDCYLTRRQTIDTAARLAGLPTCYAERVISAFAEILWEPDATGEGGRVYLASLRRAEETVAGYVARAVAVQRRGYLARRGDDEITAGLNAEQREAFELAMSGGLNVLTGGPGRGKTHTCRAIVAGLRARGRSFAILAPTGRAAARASELTGEKASTIHRFLAQVYGGLQRRRDAKKEGREPPPADPQLSLTDLILDESSMDDVELLARLLRCASGPLPSPNILMVGDPDQLPPVGPGKPFVELIESGLLPVVRLHQVMRTDAAGLIEAAAEINAGGPWGRERLSEVTQDGSFEHVDARGGAARDVVLERVRQMLERGVSSDAIQVIVANNGYTGSLQGEPKPLSNRDFNAPLGALLNPDGEPTGCEAKGDPLRINDRVMQLKNDHLPSADDPAGRGRHYVANGELGRVVSVARSGGDGGKPAGVVVDFGRDGLGVQRRVKVGPHGGGLQLAWAVTGHKFQGSEAPCVVLVATRTAGSVIDRSWLYTGVTRAARSCLLVAEGALVDKLIADEPRVRARRTGLKDLLAAVAQRVGVPVSGSVSVPA